MRRAQLSGWQRVAERDVRVRVFAGDHFYLTAQRDALTADIAAIGARTFCRVGREQHGDRATFTLVRPRRSRSSAIACRFPGGGACSPAAFWQLLVERTRRHPADRARWTRPVAVLRPATRNAGTHDDPVGRVPERSRAVRRRVLRHFAARGGDARPSQRLLLETVWEALEDATLDPAAASETPVGVYVGQWLSDFESRLFADPAQVDLYSTTGSGRYAASGRLSYFLGLTGPIGHDRYGVLVIVGGGSPRLPEPPGRRVVACDRRRRERHPAAAHYASPTRRAG